MRTTVCVCWNLHAKEDLHQSHFPVSLPYRPLDNNIIIIIRTTLKVWKVGERKPGYKVVCMWHSEWWLGSKCCSRKRRMMRVGVECNPPNDLHCETCGFQLCRLPFWQRYLMHAAPVVPFTPSATWRTLPSILRTPTMYNIAGSCFIYVSRLNSTYF